ncbi:MAG: hypothetical protein RIE31_06765 [Alphaproteobacteria bacterium]
MTGTYGVTTLHRLAGVVAGLTMIVAVFATSVRAQDLTLDAFFGTFEGSAVAESADSLFFAVRVRDLDVEIRPTGDGGFTVRWKTVMRTDGDDDNDDAARRTAQLTFRPSERSGVWLAEEANDALSPAGFGWATIDGATLAVSIITIGDTGRYNIQVYNRSLNSKGMALEFRRMVDGVKGRTVRGNLVRVAE